MIEAFAKAMTESVAKEAGMKDIPNFGKSIESKTISSFEEADKKLGDKITVANNDEKTQEYRSVNEVLKDASNEEKGIYENAKLTIGKVNGRESLQRQDINFEYKDDFGKSNLDRMNQGLAPIVEGKPIELHHINQKMDSPLAELKWDEHRAKGNDGVLHDKTKESEIDRNTFNGEKEDYWKARAKQYEN